MKLVFLPVNYVTANLKPLVGFFLFYLHFNQYTDYVKLTDTVYEMISTAVTTEC